MSKELRVKKNYIKANDSRFEDSSNAYLKNYQVSREFFCSFVWEKTKPKLFQILVQIDFDLIKKIQEIAKNSPIQDQVGIKFVFRGFYSFHKQCLIKSLV
jgi:hypothetical protein